MKPETRCPNCGSIDIVSGTLPPADPLFFRSEHIRFLRLGTADAKIGSHLCLDCGWIFLSAGTDETTSLAQAVSIFARKATAPDRPEHIGVLWPVRETH